MSVWRSESLAVHEFLFYDPHFLNWKFSKSKVRVIGLWPAFFLAGHRTMTRLFFLAGHRTMTRLFPYFYQFLEAWPILHVWCEWRISPSVAWLVHESARQYHLITSFLGTFGSLFSLDLRNRYWKGEQVCWNVSCLLLSFGYWLDLNLAGHRTMTRTLWTFYIFGCSDELVKQVMERNTIWSLCEFLVRWWLIEKEKYVDCWSRSWVVVKSQQIFGLQAEWTVCCDKKEEFMFSGRLVMSWSEFWHLNTEPSCKEWNWLSEQNEPVMSEIGLCLVRNGGVWHEKDFFVKFGGS